MTDSSPCEVLEWDSNHFGLNIGRVHIEGRAGVTPEALDRWRTAHGMECLYLLAPAGDLAAVRLAERAGFRFVDVRVTLDRTLAGETWHDAAGDVVRPFRPEDLPVLQALARRLHVDSRFHADTRFPADRSAELFARWIEQACTAPDHRVLVADVEGRAAGYIACQCRPGEPGRIQLVGVDDAARGRGLGTRLVRTALGWLSRAQASRVVVVTQGRNLHAQRLYQTCGFTTASLELWYHWWSPERRPSGTGS